MPVLLAASGAKPDWPICADLSTILRNYMHRPQIDLRLSDVLEMEWIRTRVEYRHQIMIVPPDNWSKA